MKSIYSFILLFFITSLALFSEAIGKLSKSKIKKGEPLTLEIVVEGRPNLKVPNQVVKSGGVAAEYVGTEENISIINGRTSQRKKLKFRIVTSKDGKLKTPVIPVIVDGVSEDVASIPFEVSKEKYEPPQVTSPFDDFDFPFNRMRKKPKRTTSPSPDDFVVMFHTNRDYVYLGETLVGYYILFYKNTDGFYLQRDDYKLPDFPFFLSEMLYDVGIETPRETIYNGKKYSLQPYQKEIYALTPLRKGTFSLGNAKFSIIDSGMEFDTSQKTIDSKPKNIKVFDLPSPSPPNFSGEVGVYKPFIELKKQTINLGETIPLILKVKGEGTGTLIKDPLANFCPNEECGARITFLNENRNRKFIKLDENRYGFSTEVIFNYSIYPLKEGELQLQDFELSYFNPNAEKYESKSVNFPKILVNPAKILPETPYEEEFSFWGFLIFGLFAISAGFLLIQFKEDLNKLLTSFSLKQWNIKLPFIKTTPPEIKKLDFICGNKKDALLKNYLIQKGYPEGPSEKLLQLKNLHSGLSFEEIFKKLENHQKEETVNIIRELFRQENK